MAGGVGAIDDWRCMGDTIEEGRGKEGNDSVLAFLHSFSSSSRLSFSSSSQPTRLIKRSWSTTVWA
jgi:hypothetical protein